RRRVRWRQGGARDEDNGCGCVEVRVVVAVIRELAGKFAGERWEAPKIGEKREMSVDVARDHGDDGGGDDCPPPHQTGGGCRGKGTRKPNLEAGKPAV
nr:hypothetical protein [Tanacetum cinerariifolium]